MAERVFLREATGLVREANWVDILIFALLNMSAGLSAWWLFLWGPYIVPGGNIYLAILITLIMMIFGGLSWAFLASIAPRSGGEYIFNSRILHPLLGLLSSWGWIVANFAWMGVLTAYMFDPGLITTFHLVGWAETAEFVTSPIGLIICGVIVIIVMVIISILGFKAFRVFQAACFALGITMFLVIWALFSMHSRADFIQAWNNIAAKYGTADYHTLISLTSQYIEKTYGVRAPIIQSWSITNAFPLLPVVGWGLMYPYIATYIAGETKRVERSMLIGIIGSLVLCAIMWWITTGLLERVVGYEFLVATSYAYADGLEFYTLPFSPSYFGFAMIMSPSWLRWLIGLGFTAWVAYYDLYSVFPGARILLAWSFDRLAPAAFGDVSERFHTPVKASIFIGVLGVIAVIWYALAPAYLASYIAMIPQILTCFMLTSISAMIVAYRKKTKKIYEASPVSKYKVGPIPLITISGIIYFVFLMIVLYYFIVNPLYGGWNEISIIVAGAAYLTCIIYYFAVKYY
ncbi:MAG: APC family permease, partial [Candidatus Bathyarchaeia archaeon]